MTHPRAFLLVVFLFCTTVIYAQEDNPFESIGKKAKILTASHGKYIETFDYDSVQRIGSVLINIRNRKIVRLLVANMTFQKFSNNSSASRWWGVDPIANKFPEWTPYNFAKNNPIRFNDPDGNAPNDIVTFNSQGQEIARIRSNTEFRTFVVVEEKSQIANFKNGTGQQMVSMIMEAPMPGVAQGYEDSKYQQNDYQIAASTFLFNRDISEAKITGNTSELPTPDDNHTVSSVLPGHLDVNLVKAMVLQESQGGTYTGGAGTGTTDIMQVNNKQDWTDAKARVGVTEGQAMTPQSSLNAGLKWLFLKGEGSNSSGVMSWRNGQNGDWSNAVSKYNANKKIDYSGDVQKKYNSMTPATPANY